MATSTSASTSTCTDASTVDIGDNLQKVLEDVKRAAIPGQPLPRVVAVSKMKTVEHVLAAYHAGQRHFGENYVNELKDKANDPQLVKLDGIKWHFIGHLQSNKSKMLCAIPNLWMMETVDSLNLATTLDSSVKKLELPDPLRVMIQINTSGEASKSGCQPDLCVQLVKHVVDACPRLHLCGLMTIGSVGHDYTTGPNPDFECLVKCRDNVAKETGRNDLELSMGMSADYIEAIKAGSNNVRVGSSIFGARQYPKK